MSLRAIPLLVIAFILYNLVVLVFGGGGDPVPAGDGTSVISSATAALNTPIFTITLLSGGVWSFSWGDLILLVTLFLLFVELVKSTFTTTSTLVDHALSMVLFIVMGLEFLMVPQAATSVFFLILTAAVIDVVAGYTIGIRVARRDLNIGSDA
ncbi:MAG: hypothetical protein ACT4OU_00580 [Hyphomicrobium sp.]